MQRLAFRKIFNQFSHILYLLLISFTTKFELQKSNYFCGFNINASEKKIILSLSNERNFVPSPCHTTRSGFFKYLSIVFFFNLESKIRIKLFSGRLIIDEVPPGEPKVRERWR